MEATGSYMEEVVEFMHDHGFEVSIVNPLQIKAFFNSKLLRTENDKSDSELIARFCLFNNPRIWMPQRQEVRQLREVVRMIKTLRDEVVRMKNKLESRLTNGAATSSIQAIIGEIQTQVVIFEKEMVKIVENDVDLSDIIVAFIEIKGVGFLLHTGLFQTC